MEPLIATLTQNVLEPLSAARQGTMFYNHGLDVVSWLSDVALQPPLAYLASVPVSLIGLTQLVPLALLTSHDAYRWVLVSYLFSFHVVQP
jgi:hypothetical protein